MRQKLRWLAPVAAVVLFTSASAQASIILTATSVSAAAGSSGDSFDVTIMNTGPSAQNIAGFSLGLSVSDSHITFTGGNESTALTYIFNGDSFDIINSFPYTTVPPPNGQNLEGSDLSNGGAGTSLASGATLGLGHILFNVAAGTSAGPITVTLIPTCGTPNACTSLSDAAGATVGFTANNGTITVTTAQSPEPSTLLLAFLAIPAMVWKRKTSA